MARRQEASETIVVERQEQIDELCGQARAAGRFAFDTEFVMEDRFEPDLCLVQVATERLVAVIDPFLDLDLRSIWELACDDSVETIVHAGQEDLGLCVQQVGTVPRRIFDVQIAAGLVGLEYPLSLQRLVQTLLHVRLHKTKTLTDWRRRPLSPPQIHYAAEDVRYLPSVRDMLHERLRKQNRLDWAQEEFSRFEDLSLYQIAEEQKLLRVKGMGSLKDRQLAIARELLAWRESLAKRYNRPVRLILKDHLLVEIARVELHTVQEIRQLRGINLGDRDVRSLCDAVAKAMKTPSTHWPVPPRRPAETPEESALIALLTAVTRGYCDEHHIAYSLVATKDAFRELVQQVGENPDPSDARLILLAGWRGRTVGKTLLDVLLGRRAVRVESSGGRRGIRVVDA